MKISLNWLGDLVAWNGSNPQEIAHRLTLSSAEVEEVEQRGGNFTHCCVGRIETMEKHPQADRLRVVKVQTDKGPVSVVCGGTNIEEGMLVAFAHVGAVVFHGEETMTLTQAKIRGVESNGMICAAEELGLQDRFPPKPSDGERPVMNLTGMKAKVGAPLANLFGKGDTVLHISNTAITVRPDLFSHVGFARECVALGLARAKKLSEPRIKFPSAKLPFALTVTKDAEALLPRYFACAISLQKNAPTPAWMVERLAAVGIRSISLPVDITNFVMMEHGTPMHCFDVAQLSGEVKIRTTVGGELLTTLDHVERKLPAGALVMSDDKGIFDLVGIMGGLRSSTKDDSLSLFLQAPVPTPSTIRQAMSKTGLRTDASTIFEKGVPAASSERGFLRACQLFLELSPGCRITSACKEWGNNGKAPSIRLTAKKINDLLGTSLPPKRMVQILTSLECEVKSTGSGAATTFTVRPPLHRLRDLQTPQDICEEVGRIEGFDSVEPSFPSAPLRLPVRDRRMQNVRERLCASGFQEIVALSLVGKSLLRACNFSTDDIVEIENPLGEETSILHPSCLPSLLEHASRTADQHEDMLRTFQWGRVFSAAHGEHTELCLLLSRKSVRSLGEEPFLHLKQHVSEALAAAGYQMQSEETSDVPSFAHPGRVAKLTVSGKTVGTLTQCHPAICNTLKLSPHTAIVQINLSSLLALTPTPSSFAPLPSFPGITYDTTLTRKFSAPIAKLLSQLRKAHPLLQSVEIQDLFSGGSLKPDEYNVTIRCTYRASDRTLTEEEAKSAHEKLLASAR